jgi:hypothetical protein
MIEDIEYMNLYWKGLNYLWGDEIHDSVIIKNQKSPEFLNMNLMLSAWIFLTSKKRFKDLEKIKSIRTLLGLPRNDHRKFIIDSAGFKLYSLDIEINPDQVLEVYSNCDLKPKDYVITVDRPPLPDMKATLRKEYIEETINNYKYMSQKNNKVLPVIHGWTQKEMDLSLSSCEDAEFITFPSYFTLLTNIKKDEEGNTKKIIPDISIRRSQNVQNFINTNGFKKKNITVQKLIAKRFVDFLKLYREKKLKCTVHGLGVSAGLAMHILFWTGVFTSCDSANWRVKAENFKIMFCYEDISIAECYCGKSKSISYGSSKWKPEWNTLLKRCTCPICKSLSLREKKDAMGKAKAKGFYNRAIHNAYHYWQEFQRAKELSGTKKHETYIDNRVKKSSGFYQMFWRVIKKVFEPSSQLTLDTFLKQDENRSRKFTNLL